MNEQGTPLLHREWDPLGPAAQLRIRPAVLWRRMFNSVFVAMVCGIGLAHAQPSLLPCDGTQRPVDPSALHHQQGEMDVVAWRVSGLDKNEWDLGWICLDTTNEPLWEANFYGKGSIPPSVHITVHSRIS